MNENNLNEILNMQTSKEEKSSIENKKDLNVFIYFVLIVSIFRSIYVTGLECLIMSNNSYAHVFYTFSVVTIFLHIAGIAIILTKKKLLGVIILYANWILFMIIGSIIINNILGCSLFDDSKMALRGFCNIFFLSVLLLLRSSGKSGWDVLLESYKKTNGNRPDRDSMANEITNTGLNDVEIEQNTQNKPDITPLSKLLPIIVYVLTGIVLAFCIYSLFQIL
jgi:hypothetical protein